MTVIGHRGSGANRNTGTTLQIGENSVLSFITAANMGASHVEFDVQVTRDGVPVIYHDWTLSESGVSTPVNCVSLAQFRSLGKGKTQRRHRQSSHSDDETCRSASLVDIKSLRGSREVDAKGLTKPQLHSHGGRGDTSIKAPFATLAESLIVNEKQ